MLIAYLSTCPTGVVIHVEKQIKKRAIPLPSYMSKSKSPRYELGMFGESCVWSLNSVSSVYIEDRQFLLLTYDSLGNKL